MPPTHLEVSLTRSRRSNHAVDIEWINPEGGEGGVFNAAPASARITIERRDFAVDSGAKFAE